MTCTRGALSVTSRVLLCCSVLLLVVFAGCSAPLPDRVSLSVPEDAPAPVDVVVTLSELPGGEQVSRATYTITPGESVSVDDLEDGVPYRVDIAVGGTTAWSEELGAREFVALQVTPDGTVQDVGGGTYGTTTAERTSAAGADGDVSRHPSGGAS